MKKTFILIAVFLLNFNFATAQIILEESYDYSATYTKLAHSGYKIYIMDVVASECRIYNTDHSLWKTINLSIPANNYLYDIKYVSEGLFTNDNTLSLVYIYYYYDETFQYYTYNAKVVTENGTELLSIPGCQYLYATTIPEEGTKMVAYSYDYSILFYTVQTNFYDLPGELVSGTEGLTSPEVSVKNAFPNPATDFSTVPYELPDGVEEGKIQISDIQGKIIQTFKVDNHFDHLRVNTQQYPRGTYFYRLIAGNYSSRANKLIIE